MRGLSVSMILYSLVCEQRHTFESWFSNSTAYDRTAEAGALSCPECGSSQVSKALTAPYVSKRGHLRGRDERTDTDDLAKGKGCEASVERSGGMPDLASEGSGPEVSKGSDQESTSILTDADRARRQALGRARRFVQDHCDYVGGNFAEEARKIHYGETTFRPIYGEASLQESQKLQEEGISFLCLPLSKENA